MVIKELARVVRIQNHHLYSVADYQICLFYLVLRALDTIEDDMTLPNSTKLPMLRSMHLKLHEPGWNFDGSGPNESDRIVLVEFENVQSEFADLDPKLVFFPMKSIKC
jgi:phytoene/squalene synthetase